MGTMIDIQSLLGWLGMSVVPWGKRWFFLWMMVGEDEGGPGGGVCPLPCAGPCQDLPVTPCGLCDHAVSDVVRVLVP